MPTMAEVQAAQVANQAATDAAAKAASDGAAAAAAQKAASDKAASDAAAGAKAASDAAAAKAISDKAASDKAAADSAAAEAAKKAESEFKLTLPKDAKLESSELEKFTAKMKEYGVTPQVAQRLLESGLADRKAGEEAIAKQRTEMDATWQKQIETKYGPKFAEANAMAKRGFDIIDPDQSIRKGMEAAGLKNWPAVFDGMERLGRMAASDRLHVESAAGADNSKLTPEQKIEQQYRKAAGKA